jgi:hypothetical protein
MVDRAKLMPAANLHSQMFETLIGKHLRLRLPVVRVLLTIAIVAVSIAVAVLTS